MSTGAAERHGRAQEATACPLCGGPTRMDLTFPLADVRHCPECAHRFSVNVPVSPAEIYTQAYFREHHRRWFDHPDLVLFEQIRTRLLELGVLPDEPLLDVGCGEGHFLNYLNDKGFRQLWGVDLVTPPAPRFTHVCSNVFSYEPEQPLGAVVSMMNIEHLNDPVSYLQRLGSWLKPNGVLVINTIDDDSLIYTLSRFLYRAGLAMPARRMYDPHHLSHFSGRSLLRACETAKLRPRMRITKNYPLETVDLPDAPHRRLLLAAIALVNLAASLGHQEISQTLFLQRQA